MDIKNIWEKLPQENDDLEQFLQQSKIVRLKSAHPLLKLKKNLYYSLILAIIISLVYIFIILWFPIWPVRIAIFVVLLFNIWTIFTSRKIYTNIVVDISPDISLRNELLKQKSTFENWWKAQKKFAFFIYPVAAAGGFMLGGFLGSGKPVEELMVKPLYQIALLITVIILVPLSLLFAKWLFNLAYGKHLKKLGDLLKDLDNGN